MGQDQHLRERIARYRRLTALVTDERALRAIDDLCDEMERQVRADERALPDQDDGAP